MRTPPASSPGPSEGVLCSTLPSGRRVIARGSWEQEFKVMVAVEVGLCVSVPIAEPEVANVAGDTGQRNRKEDSS